MSKGTCRGSSKQRACSVEGPTNGRQGACEEVLQMLLGMFQFAIMVCVMHVRRGGDATADVAYDCETGATRVTVAADADIT